MLYYLDASAWIKRYCIEKGTDRIEAFFAAGPRVGCSALGLVEVVCTLTRKARAKEIRVADAAEKHREAQRDFSLFYQVFLTPELLHLACQYAKKYGLRGADTIHLASCLELRRHQPRGKEDLVLISSDTELLAAAGSCAVKTVDPSKTDIPVVVGNANESVIESSFAGRD